MNKTLLTGRITKDPEMQGAEGKEVCHFTLAVNRPLAKDGQQQADFISCVAFGKIAQFLSKYIGKGYQLAIEGRITTGSYQGQDGQTKYTTDVVVERLENLTPKSDTPKSEAPSKVETPQTPAAPKAIDVSDDDLPF